jgi:hypothetical protein
VTAVVTSANAGSFNTIQLVGGSGNLLNYTVLTGNSGTGMTNLAVGSIVSFLVTIPNGNTQVQFKARTAKDGTVVSTATNSNTTVVTDPATPTGIMNVLPNYFNLTPTNESQVITFSNSGNGPISSLSFTPSNPLTKLSNNCGATLAAGASCQYVVKFDKNIPKAGTSGVTVNYNNGISTQSATATVNYTGVDPIAGLTITSDNANFDFTSRTNTPTQTSLVTLTNSGNSDESDFSYSFGSASAYFSTNTSGITENPCTSGIVLAPSESCSFNLVYTNNVATTQTSENLQINYKFGQNSLNGSTNVNISYQTIQSSAILNVTPNPATFSGIVNNGVESSFQTLTVSNTGDETATNIASGISGNSSSLFTIVNNRCATSLPAGGNCTQDIRFGSTTSGQGTKNASLDITYVSYLGALVSTSSASLSGVVSTAQSAIINSVFTSTHGYVGGNGESQTPYQIQQESSGLLPQITYTITNTGLVAANNFYISPPMIDTGWMLGLNTCGSSNSTITLNAAGGSCTMEFIQSSITTVGAYPSLNLSNYTAHWVDQDSPSGQDRALSGIKYVNIFAPPSIKLTPESALLATAESTTITVTLRGGYNVSPQLITLANVQPSELSITYLNSSCSVSSSSATCSINVMAESTAVLQSYTAAVDNAGNLTNSVLESQIYTITVPGRVFVTKGNYAGNFNFKQADYVCMSDSQSKTGQSFKAMLYAEGQRSANPLSNWVLKPNYPYVNMNKALIAYTNTNAVFPSPLTNPIYVAGLGTQSAAWTGLEASWSGTSSKTCYNGGQSWNSNSSIFGPLSGMVGFANTTDIRFIASGTTACSGTSYEFNNTRYSIGLYCVQQ